MTQYRTFVNKNSKLNDIYQETLDILYRISQIEKQKPIEQSVPVFKMNKIYSLDTTPTYYDLYDWNGIIYTSIEPEPSTAYQSGYRGGWFFLYPTQDFRVPQGIPAHLYAPGTSEDDWEYTKTVGIIQTQLTFHNMTERVINYMKLKSYIYNDINETVNCLDFNESYRWHQEGDNYTFYYNAFFSVEDADSQLLVKAELCAINPNTYDALTKEKIK